MRIIFTVASFYDWERLPENAVVTDEDVQANRVKPNWGGGWLMRVRRDLPKEAPTTTEVQLPETELLAMLFHMAMKEKMVVDRAAAATSYVGQHVMEHHFHRAFVRKVELEDEGPVPALFESEFERFRAAGKLQAEDHDEMLAAYERAYTNEELISAFVTRFNFKLQKEVP